MLRTMSLIPCVNVCMHMFLLPACRAAPADLCKPVMLFRWLLPVPDPSSASLTLFCRGRCEISRWFVSKFGIGRNFPSLESLLDVTNGHFFHPTALRYRPETTVRVCDRDRAANNETAPQLRRNSTREWRRRAACFVSALYLQTRAPGSGGQLRGEPRESSAGLTQPLIPPQG